MIVKKIFDFFCFFIIAPITVFFSVDTLITSFQTHQIKTQIDLSQYKCKEFDIGTGDFAGARIRPKKPEKEAYVDKWEKYRIKNSSEDTIPREVETTCPSKFDKYKKPKIKIISYWPTYSFLKDIFIISFIWIWLILAYRFLTRH